VIALGVMVAGSSNRGWLPFLKTRNIYWRGKARYDRFISK
jgi:hypothetical protein